MPTSCNSTISNLNFLTTFTSGSLKEDLLSFSLSPLCPPSLTFSHTQIHTQLLDSKSQIWPTCGVSFPTLWVIGSFITTSTLQASFSLGMVNFRSSWDRKAELPFITLTPWLTWTKVGLAQPGSSSSRSRAPSPPQLGELMPTGAKSFLFTGEIPSTKEGFSASSRGVSS